MSMAPRGLVPPGRLVVGRTGSRLTEGPAATAATARGRPSCFIQQHRSETRVEVEMAGSMTSAIRADYDVPRAPGGRLRHAYGFDDVALVPGTVAADPGIVDVAWRLGGHRLELPFVASAMDGVVDVAFAVELGRRGGLAVLNLEGLQTRYERPEEQLAAVAGAPADAVTSLMQDLYR